MPKTTFLQRALRPGSIEFTWLCSTTVLVGLTAVLVITTALMKANDFHWAMINGFSDPATHQTVGKSVSEQEYLDQHETGRGDQCERLKPSSVTREFQNSWSNLAYVYAGLLVLCRSRRLSGWALGAHFILVGITSGLYHASNYGSLDPIDFQKWDVAALNAALISMLMFAIEQTLSRFLPRLYGEFCRTLGGFIVRLACILVLPMALGTTMATFRTSVPVFNSTVTFVVFVGALFALVCGIVVMVFSSVQNHSDYADIVNDLDPSGYDPYNPFASGGIRPLVANWLQTKFVHNIWGWLAIIIAVAGAAFFFRLNDGRDSAPCGKLLQKYPDILTAHPTIRTEFKDLLEDAQPKMCCWEDGAIQAHALWHILSAATLLLGYDLFARLSITPKPRVFVYHPSENG